MAGLPSGPNPADATVKPGGSYQRKSALAIPERARLCAHTTSTRYGRRGVDWLIDVS